MAQGDSTDDKCHQEDLFQELFGDDISERKTGDDSSSICSSSKTDERMDGPTPDGQSPDDTVSSDLVSKIIRIQLGQPALPDRRAVESPAPGFVICRQALGSELCELYFEWLNTKYFCNTPYLQSSDKERSGAQRDLRRVNQGMHFGALSDNLTPLGFLANACLNIGQLLPKDLVGSRRTDGPFDQAIINLYDPGEGIGDHIDLLRFEDGIVGYSFGSSATLRLRRLSSEAEIDVATQYAREPVGGGVDDVLVKINAGDVYAMAGEARFRWTHGFPAQIDGGANVRGRRISVTLRRLQIA
ncbi:hypothetical protein GGI25_000322 [Coemansia spiralis]|uniref:Fe2OG dioxygenase domain-containing protein n=2 Tax=Coemansia TaxID=4863 RepID=A0A9W8G7Z2_9FUNG|nr:hypothetical protein EDC05_001656 [Coemansia umbellata]KAJ2624230.1 hypothetical protein GGI26_001586 [Coemansia sp. RSA 1358]KAJ2681016.1 hypothetical protein GGI25_000322 [Coemansia spiralis]